MPGAHTENDQVCQPISGDVQNPLIRGSKLPPEFNQAFYLTP
jgi:hypothetical protein